MPFVIPVVASVADFLLPAVVAGGSVDLAAVAAAGAGYAAAGGAVGAGAGIAAFLGGPFGSLLLTGGLIGLNYALAPGLPRGIVNSPEVRSTIRAAAADKRDIYGRCVVGGVWFYYDDDHPPYQRIGLLLAAHRISAPRALIINTNRIVFVGGARFNEILDPLAVEGQDYAGNLRVSFQSGAPGQGVDPLIADFEPDIPDSFIQNGAATCVLEGAFGADEEEFRNRWGSVAFIDAQVELDGRLVYDPRVPSCRWPRDMNDRDEMQACEATWVFRRTAALCQADYMIQPHGGRWRPDRVRLDELARAADWDDQLVVNKDGSHEPRHCIDGLITRGQNRRAVIEGMLSANRCFITDDNSRLGFVSSRPQTPVASITERQLAGGIKFQKGKRRAERYNEVAGRFAPPERNYREDDGPIFTNEDYVAQDGERRRTTIRAPFTSSHRTLQRLEFEFLEEARLGDTLTLTLRLGAVNASVGDVVRVAFRRLHTEVNGLYRIASDGLDPSGPDSLPRVSVQLTRYDPSIAVRYDPQQQEQPFALPAEEAA